MPNKIDETKTFHAVFDINNIKEVDSYDNAFSQSPSYIITSYNIKGSITWAGQNWSRKWEINNLTRPGSGFTKGLWKSGKEFETDSAFSPGTPYYEIIDPKGIKRRFRTESVSKGTGYIQQVISKVNQLYNYDSWEQFDLEIENTKLKSRVLELETEVLLLRNRLSEEQK